MAGICLQYFNFIRLFQEIDADNPIPRYILTPIFVSMYIILLVLGALAGAGNNGKQIVSLVRCHSN